MINKPADKPILERIEEAQSNIKYVIEKLRLRDLTLIMALEVIPFTLEACKAALKSKPLREPHWLENFYKQWEHELQCAEINVKNNYSGSGRIAYYDEGAKDGLKRVIVALKANMDNQESKPLDDAELENRYGASQLVIQSLLSLIVPDEDEILIKDYELRSLSKTLTALHTALERKEGEIERLTQIIKSNLGKHYLPKEPQNHDPKE